MKHNKLAASITTGIAFAGMSVPANAYVSKAEVSRDKHTAGKKLAPIAIHETGKHPLNGKALLAKDTHAVIKVGFKDDNTMVLSEKVKGMSGKAIGAASLEMQYRDTEQDSAWHTIGIDPLTDNIGTAESEAMNKIKNGFKLTHESGLSPSQVNGVAELAAQGADLRVHAEVIAANGQDHQLVANSRIQ